jgi:hypothetical protein
MSKLGLNDDWRFTVELSGGFVTVAARNRAIVTVN